MEWKHEAMRSPSYDAPLLSNRGFPGSTAFGKILFKIFIILVRLRSDSLWCLVFALLGTLTSLISSKYVVDPEFCELSFSSSGACGTPDYTVLHLRVLQRGLK